MKKETYRAASYAPDLVTGRYVRVEGSKGKGYTFKVFEAATCWVKGQFYGKAGYGPTLREYLTSGEELPAALRELCIKSKKTELWA